jgi:uncharacterized protein involved in type VI secretion and phage assembly
VTTSLYDTVRSIVRDELSTVRGAELAVVEETHPHASDSDKDNYACSVRLRDTGLVLKRVPVATDRIGSVSVPLPGELVLVQFLRGQLNAPVIVGRLYNEEDRPPTSDEGQSIVHLPKGAGDSEAARIELHHGDERRLLVKLGDGLELTLQDDDPVVDLSVDGGQATLTIDRDGTITLKGSSDLTIEAGGSMTIKAGGTLDIQGSTVNIN